MAINPRRKPNPTDLLRQLRSLFLMTPEGEEAHGELLQILLGTDEVLGDHATRDKIQSEIARRPDSKEADFLREVLRGR